MALIRTFIAVEFSEELKTEIARIQQAMKQEMGPLKWVQATNFHLTLKFLGDVESSKIGALGEGLARAVKGTTPFYVGFAGVGGFPKTQHPRVLWLGIDRGKSELVSLQKVVDDELALQGYPRETKSFSPHLTMARTNEGTNLTEIGQKLVHMRVEPTSSDLIRCIRVMKSDLRPGGPVYTCLKQIDF